MNISFVTYMSRMSRPGITFSITMITFSRHGRVMAGKYPEYQSYHALDFCYFNLFGERLVGN